MTQAEVDEKAQNRQNTVTISINGDEYQLHRGRRTVSELKDAGHVPQADELEQIVDGKLTPLPDDGAVTIKGREQFISHPRDSGSSYSR
jgi:hypothetical protein